MPMFDYKCDNCKVVAEEYVRRYDDRVICSKCGREMIKLMPTFKYQFKTGDFFEAYTDTDIHPDGKPINIGSKEEFFTQCRKYGKGYRKISDKMR